ncbi:hypothetical protein D3C72_2092770 [compost metagenome]
MSETGTGFRPAFVTWNSRISQGLILSMGTMGPLGPKDSASESAISLVRSWLRALPFGLLGLAPARAKESVIC